MVVTVIIVTAVVLASATWFLFGGPRFPTDPIDRMPVPAGAAVLVGAGDIARCTSGADEATARLLDAIDGTVFTAGDNAYELGTERQFRDCYEPSWGRHRSRTIPAAGNHDWLTDGAAGYHGYFGAAAGPGDVTWYQKAIGSWLVVVLDSACSQVGGCDADSAQGRWLADVLDEGDGECTLAIWHQPRFSSGWHGDDPGVAPFWEALLAAGAEVVVNGHDHDYERFAPQNADGSASPDGIRQFVAGTGGAALRDFEAPRPNSEIRDRSTHGVLRLVLWPDRYEWQFIGVDGAIRDQGTDRCRQPLP